MKLKVTRTDIWRATIDDRPGGAADSLERLAKAGANLEFLLARRTPEEPGKGVMFAAPLKGARVLRVAQEAGFAKAADIHGLRVEGGDVPGLAARMTRALAAAGVSFRGLSAIAQGRKFVAYLSLDTAEDATQATRTLKKVA